MNERKRTFQLLDDQTHLGNFTSIRNVARRTNNQTRTRIPIFKTLEHDYTFYYPSEFVALSAQIWLKALTQDHGGSVVIPSPHTLRYLLDNPYTECFHFINDENLTEQLSRYINIGHYDTIKELISCRDIDKNNKSVKALPRKHKQLMRKLIDEVDHNKLGMLLNEQLGQKLVWQQQNWGERKGNIYTSYCDKSSDMYSETDFIENLKDAIRKHNSGTKIFFSFVIFCLAEDGSSFGHANIIAYDPETETMERYDPNGMGVEDINDCTTFEQIDDDLFALFRNHNIPLKTLITPKMISNWELNNYGPQCYEKDEVETDPGGFCLAWSMLFAYVRMFHPHQKPEQINKGILDEISRIYGRENITAYIRTWSNVMLKKGAEAMLEEFPKISLDKISLFTLYNKKTDELEDISLPETMKRLLLDFAYTPSQINNFKSLLNSLSTQGFDNDTGEPITELLPFLQSSLEPIYRDSFTRILNNPENATQELHNLHMIVPNPLSNIDTSFSSHLHEVMDNL